MSVVAHLCVNFFFIFSIPRHVDGTVKFWDTSSLTLQVLYRLKTSKVFEKSRTKTLRPDGEVATGVLAVSEPGKQHLAIKQLAMCPENRLLAVAGASGHVILFKFRRQEASMETTVCIFEPFDIAFHAPN